jgi:hypothetical protein
MGETKLHPKDKKNTSVFLRVLFFLFMLLFISNNMTPYLFDLDTGYIEFSESNEEEKESEKEKEKEETEEEIEVSDYIHTLLAHNYLYQIEIALAARPFYNWNQPFYDISTPPPELA